MMASKGLLLEVRGLCIGWRFSHPKGRRSHKKGAYQGEAQIHTEIDTIPIFKILRPNLEVHIPRADSTPIFSAYLS